MKPNSPAPAEDSASTTRRRGFFAGLGAVGAVGVLAGLSAQTATPELAEAAPAVEPPARGGGYQLSAHVQRYYDTTRV
jgi:hypothetical protein